MIAKRVAVQLVKEFSLPFVGALLWAFLGGGDQALTLAGWIARFSTAFFFLSWLGGQLFRVTKQVKTESSLGGIRTRIEDVVATLEASARQVAGWTSGGDSFAYLLPVMNGADQARELPIIAVNGGEYPVYDVTARIADLDRLLTGPGLTLMDHLRSNVHVQVGELAAGLATMPGGSFPVGSGEDGASCRFNIFFSGRNGQWTQLLRLRHDGRRWMVATKVYRGNIRDERVMLHEQIDEHFPSPDTLDWD